MSEVAPIEQVTAVEEVGGAGLDERLRAAAAPFVVRGLASGWPLVRAGIDGGGAAASA